EVEGLAVAPDRGLDRGLLHRAFELAIARNRPPVNREQDVAAPEQLVRGRGCDRAGHAQRAPAARVVVLEDIQPLVADSVFACLEQRGVRELGLERVDGLAGADLVYELADQLA